MCSLRESMLEGSQDLIEQIRSHPFIVQTVSGTIPDAIFRRFTIQNYLRLREFERSLAALLARAPESVRDRLKKGILRLHGEIELYEELAAKLDVNLPQARMTFACHSCVCFLHATVNMRSFEEATAAFYGNEFAILTAWNHAGGTQRTPSPWQDFVDIWAGAAIQQWVECLAEIFDSFSRECSTSCKELMVETFRTALQYRLEFWDMAFQKADW